MTSTLSIPASLIPALTGALRFQIDDLAGCTHPETQAVVEEAKTALALLARAQPHPDEARLDKLESLIESDASVEDLLNLIDGAGSTLRDAIDGL